MKEMVGGCCVCSDERGWTENPLVYCDGQGCTVAVHQACYGIVTVPTGPWYCRKCESQERAARVRCELCPSRDGALKRTDNAGWAHVVCALYIPEVRFGNVTTMEPIILQLIPQERFNKTCYICQDMSKGTRASIGACMQCNKTGCRMQFHVTCAQALGLLCEEAGNYLDNVKYCGYCQHHYSKLKKVGNIKVIPPYKPVATEHNSSDSSPEKELDTQNATTSIVQNPMHQSTKTSVVVPASGTKPESQASKNANRKAVSTSGKTATQNPSGSSPGSTSTNLTSIGTTNPLISKNVMVNLSKDKHITKSIKSGTNLPKVSEKDKNNKTKITTSSTSSNVPSKAKESSESGRKTPNIIEKSGDKVPAKKEQGVAINTEQDVKLNQGQLKKRKADSRTSTPVPDQVSENVHAPTSNVIVTPMDTRDDAHKKIKTEHSPSPPLTTDNTYNQLKINTMVAPTIPKTEVISPVPPTVLQPPPVSQPTSLVVSVPLSTASPAMSQMSNNLYQHLSREPNEAVNRLSPGQNAFIDRSSPMSAAGLEPRMSNSPNTMQSVLSQGHQIGAVATLASQQSIGGDLEDNLHRNEGGGGLKITFEKQIKTEDSKRSRSSRSHPTPPPMVANPNAQGHHLQQNNVLMGLTPKESPSSSPNPDEQPKRKGRKPLNQSSSPAPDSKQDIKLFQNGVHAPHMLGNQLNPNSNMAQKMSDHLNHELEAHSVFSSESDANPSGNLVGPPLLRHTTKSGNSNMSGNNPVGNLMSGVTGSSNTSAVVPQSLDQLLERQWEQGSQFLMEQAQHFDIASLLSCLHQLRTENVRLEDHVNNLVTRRDHLLAVNARLAIPLTQPPNQSVANTTAESAASGTRNMRPMENGIVSQDIYRTQQQTQVRHSPASQYQQNSVNIQHGNIRTASREQVRTNYQPYSVVTSQQHQVVVRRDDNHVQASQKPPN